MRNTTKYPHSNLTQQITGAAMAVHSEMGPGLLESPYQAALEIELTEHGLSQEREAPIDASYRGRSLGLSYRADFIVEEIVVVETKAIEQINPVHLRQLLTYLRASGLPVGLLLNFGVSHMRDGIHRLIST